MATPAQIAANRANALKSTGPRTPEGKAASRFNALKHGLDAESVIIPGENSADYDALVRDYQSEFSPESPSEAFHVETMIRADWNKRRLVRMESELYATVLEESGQASLVKAILSGSPAAKLLTRVQRQIAAFERAWYRAHKALTDARQAAEAAQQAAFETFLDRPYPLVPTTQLASFPETAHAALPVRHELLSNPALRL
jgi:hypothetical protein